MPRAKQENRGGVRQGKPGKPMPNRADLRLNTQGVTTAPSKEYGSRAAQERAQAAVPLGAVPPVTVAGAGGQGGGAPAMIPLDAPTARPEEPVTQGAPFGDGFGPQALGLPPTRGDDELIGQVRTLFAAHPNEDLRQLIEELEMRNL